MRVIALVNLVRRCPRGDDVALHRLIGAVENLYLVPPDHRPVALVEICDFLRQRGQRQRVRTEVIFTLPITQCQRRPHSRANHQIGMVTKQKGNRERPV